MRKRLSSWSNGWVQEVVWSKVRNFFIYIIYDVLRYIGGSIDTYLCGHQLRMLNSDLKCCMYSFCLDTFDHVKAVFCFIDLLWEKWFHMLSCNPFSQKLQTFPWFYQGYDWHYLFSILFFCPIFSLTLSQYTVYMHNKLRQARRGRSCHTCDCSLWIYDAFVASVAKQSSCLEGLCFLCVCCSLLFSSPS